MAGPGVDQKLLGTVHRPGIGDQVTYGGHPLYLFDPASQPFTPEGEGYLESVAPMYPWHGIWYLVSAKDGQPRTRPGHRRHRDLAGQKTSRRLRGVPHPSRRQGSADLPVTVYSYSLDRAGISICTGACAVTWPPLLTDGQA